MSAANQAAALAAEKLSVTSTAFKSGACVPKKYTGDGQDFSPPIAWSKGPVSTKSYAISCLDPDAPVGTWWHWIIFNINPKTQQFYENIPKTSKLAEGICQGLNDFQKPGYNGPAPPPGTLHHYHFKVIALDCLLKLAPSANKDAYTNAIKGHVLAEGELVGTYKR